MEDETSQKDSTSKVLSKTSWALLNVNASGKLYPAGLGLFDRRETLEQIGELLGITRERVRQLEKAVVTRLKAG